MHPLMPFITEEIWQRVSPLCQSYAGMSDISIMTQRFPLQDANLRDQQVMDDMEWVKSFIVGIRNIRGEMDISPNKPLSVLLRNASEQDWQRLQSTKAFLGALAKRENIDVLAPDEVAPASATALVGEMEILIPMAGLIDKDAELGRIARALDKIEKDFSRTQGKLNNEKFVANAPAEVIDKEKAKLADFEMQMAKLREQKQTISEL
jgi:valyl-tRNA synthetase